MAIVTRMFSVEELEEKYGLPGDNVLYFERWDKRRWYTVCKVVFQADDELFWEVHYLEPASEMQEGQDRWESDPVEAVRVTKQIVERVVWTAGI